MALKLYDTLTREKRVFVPIDPARVRMYVCGPTVYDFAHIGNARPVIVFDVLFRLLRHVYGADHGTYVRNITDVDDKINDRAARDYPGLPLNEAIRKVTEITERQFHEDVDALGALRPPGEPSWPSPSGIKAPGRPGWHIECSAMAWKHLGEQFDIHGGGIDLKFPHHENELAQTCCAFHASRMADVWMHNGFLQVESEKMSKSLGNFITIRELLADWPGEVLRLTMLKTHYRSPLDWTLRSVEETAKTLDDWYAVAADAEAGAPSPAVI